jgi:hypothetical protein
MDWKSSIGAAPFSRVKDSLARRLLAELGPSFADGVETDRTVLYRGYTITWHRTLAGWIGRFRKTDTLRLVSDNVVSATLEDGEAVLLRRARARIDRVLNVM